MIDVESKQAHTTNLVPLVYMGGEDLVTLKEKGSLLNLAPTLLAILGIQQPADMTRESLLSKN